MREPATVERSILLERYFLLKGLDEILFPFVSVGDNAVSSHRLRTRPRSNADSCTRSLAGGFVSARRIRRHHAVQFADATVTSNPGRYRL